jgi:hypothetical protein
MLVCKAIITAFDTKKNLIVSHAIHQSVLSRIRIRRSI